MDELSLAELSEHLETLSGDLGRFEPKDYFPWSLGRLFNELLKQTKLQLGSHPLVNTIGGVKENPDQDLHPGASNATVGTILGVVGQLRTALALHGGGEFAEGPPLELSESGQASP